MDLSDISDATFMLEEIAPGQGARTDTTSQTGLVSYATVSATITRAVFGLTRYLATLFLAATPARDRSRPFDDGYPGNVPSQ